MAKRKPATIPGLTMQQPYAWQVIEGQVTIERRTHQTDYRGPIALIAGGRDVNLRRRVMQFQEKHPDCPDGDDLPCSVILGVIDLVDIYLSKQPGMRYTWELRKPRMLKKPKPFDGAGNLVEVPKRLVKSLL